MSSSLYRIFNQGEIASLGAGWRSVIALKPGRRWVTILDWTTLQSTRLLLDLWSVSTRSPPPAIRRAGCGPRSSLPRRRPGARLRYVRKTKTISAAARLLK